MMTWQVLEKADAHAAASTLEQASMRRMAEAERRERSLGSQFEATRQADMTVEMQSAELRRTMRAAEL